MYKPFAKVDGLHCIFDTQVNALGKTTYDTTHVIDSAKTTYNVTDETIFYIVTDDDDNAIGYRGTYIYSHGELFSNYDNKGGQYIKTGIVNSTANASTVFLLGKVTPLYSHTPWSITYHIQSYSDDNSFNGDFDVCIHGIDNNIYSSFAYNGVNGNPPYRYHIFKKTQNTNYIEIGLCLYDAEDNNTLNRNISLIISDYKDCSFEFYNSAVTTTLDLSYAIEADKLGFVEQLGSDDQLAIPNVIFEKMNYSLKSHPKTLYGFDLFGKIAPITSVAADFNTNQATNDRLYATALGFDYTRGIYYSNNYSATVPDYVEGTIYSAYSGFDFGYFDNINQTTLRLNPVLPIFIKGSYSFTDKLFFPEVITGDAYPHCWTQSIQEDGKVYWLIGFPQNDRQHANLLDNNKLYWKVNGKIVEFNPNAKDISFTPSGEVSTPTFYGTAATISVSGVPEGTNSESAVTIVPTTASINSMTTVGALPSLDYTAASELLSFDPGELPAMEAVAVWVGYASATASAQTFTGSTVTFTGSYTPAGTVSQPTFTGDEITIHT